MVFQSNIISVLIYIILQEETCYSLTGVLMHVGPDANHGHYIAHIQELETGNWFKFSDEHVVALDKKSYSQQAEDTS